MMRRYANHRRSRSLPLSILLLPACVLAALSGCSWFGSSDFMEAPGPKLAQVIDRLPELEVPTTPAAVPSREDVMTAYRRIYGSMADPAEDRAVGKRLADLEMSVGEDLDIAGRPEPYQAAISLYESLLEKTDGGNQDEILYQLARAYELAGQTDRAVGYLDRLVAGYPQSRYLLEAHFRRAEIAFSRERYRQASEDYAFVVAQGPDTPYWQNANYMRGWALFKTSDLDASLVSFFAVIDSLLPDNDPESLAATDRELLDDSFRVVTLALGYLDGPVTLAEQMAALQRPHWQYFAYQTLAEDYLQRERYLDSVATWQMFIDENPLDARAPNAHIGMIQTLIEADFPSEVRPKKEMFVRGYGIFSEFWDVHGETAREGYIDTLKEYLDELSKLAHAEAQESAKRTDYLAAASWYEELVATFPEDPETAEYVFLLGEVYTEADDFDRAVDAYQRVVRQFPDYPQAHEAGYAAILGLEVLVERAPADEREIWQHQKIDAQIEFAAVFPADPRAPAVQTDAADGLFQLHEYDRAVELADNLLRAWPDLPWSLRRTALLVVGHGWFELGDYAGSERAYRQLLAGELAEQERDSVKQRLLASIYKQGEASEQGGELDLAVSHFLRLKDIDPTSKLAIKGHYDAVAVTESAGRIGEAAALLADFRRSYPDSELGRDTAKRLAAMYEQTGDQVGAAQEYVRLAGEDADAEVRRQSLYRAAELYLELDDPNSAVTYFKDYAHTYPSPLDLRLEAMHNLDLLYQRLGDGESRRYWLAEMIELRADLGSGATERATYLAAQAQYVLAEDERAAFDAVRLTNPLKKSLQRKQQALKRSLQAFEAAAAYQVADFTSASTFQIADLYASLSTAIMQSERPSGLSPMEQEQYDILLEEQAYPFEEQAISLHEINMRRSWEGDWDPWIEKSFSELGRLMPARFDKPEVEVAYVEAIH